MRNYYDRTWKIGELAKMFDINVQLLRHYDKEGLLVPEIRNPDNNWRSYKYDQIYSLGMIRYLRLLDCSLDDIGMFMRKRNPEVTENFLRRRMKTAKVKYEKLLRMESVVNDRFALINREKKYADSDQIFEYSEEEICYIEIGGIEESFIDDLLYLYPTLVFYNGEDREFAVWIPSEDIPRFEKYKDRIRKISADDYLVGFHTGPYDDIFRTFEKMERYADGLLDGECHLDKTRMCIDIIDRFIEADSSNFLTKVMIKIYR